VPLNGEGRFGDETVAPGGVWLADSDAPFDLPDGADLLLAYPGSAVNATLPG